MLVLSGTAIILYSVGGGVILAGFGTALCLLVKERTAMRQNQVPLLERSQLEHEQDETSTTGAIENSSYHEVCWS